MEGDKAAPRPQKTALIPQPPLPQAGEGEPEYLISNSRPLAGEGQARSARVRAALRQREGRLLHTRCTHFPLAFYRLTNDGTISSVVGMRWQR